VVGSGPTRWQIVASIGNFLLFFGRDIVQTLRYRRRKIAVQTKRYVAEKQPAVPRHRCHVCGRTNLTDPTLDFRYCSKCAGDQCYCPDHIFNHVHVLTDEGTAKKS
jgi:Pyruvate/2-oxoacid:ferredoxin oxidoreductase delta subunit